MPSTKTRKRSLVLPALAALTLSLASLPGAAAELFDKLPAASRARLVRGEQVVRTQDMPDSSWPAVTVYALAGVPPEAAAAVFTDYAEQADYLRECCGLVQSVVKDPAVGGDPKVQRVLYELNVPIFSNEQYELRETITHSEDDTYTVTWKKVGGTGRSDDIVGRAYFEPHAGGTLFSYFNFVKMNALGAGLFAGQAVDRTRATVNAMARHWEKVHAAGGPKMAADLARLRAALGE